MVFYKHSQLEENKNFHILALLNNRILPLYLYAKFNKIAIVQNILHPRPLFNRKVFQSLKSSNNLIWKAFFSAFKDHPNTRKA